MSAIKFVIILVGCFFILASLTGIAVYGAYTVLRGPIWLRNQFIGVWLSLVMLFYSSELIYEVKKHKSRLKNACVFGIDIAYYTLVVLACAFITVCYGILHRLDSVVFAGITCLLAMTSLISLIVRRTYPNRLNLHPNEQGKLVATTELNTTAAGKVASSVDPPPGRCVTCLGVINFLLKLVFLVVLGLLANGAATMAVNSLKYPPRGKFLNIRLNDTSGRSLRVHYLCDGPLNDTHPTFVFEGDGSHGYADYLGLQMLLVKENRRSCIWDKPGLGYSDFMFADMKDYKLYYDTFIRTVARIENQKKFIFVAWGGGGLQVYEYASQSPDMVHSMTFLDVAPARIEWTTQAVLKNLTAKQLDQLIAQDMRGRFTLVYLINSIGVPLGLLRYFLPVTDSYPVELVNEKRSFFLGEKTWITQRYFMDGLANQTDVFSTLSVKDSIPINHIMTVKSNQQIINQVCAPRKLAPTSNECLYEQAANDYSIRQRKRLVNLTQNGRVYECALDECDLGFYVYNGPQFTVDALLKLYP